MKTTAFLIRVAICFLLSLVPLTELENQIYSLRMQLRGRSERAPNIVILSIEPGDFAALKQRFAALPGRAAEPAETGLRDLFYWDPDVFREVLRRLLSQDPAAVLITWHIPHAVAESLPEPVGSLARNPRVIWSSQFDAEGKFLRPARALTTKSNFGFNNLIADSDGVIRRSALLRQTQPSLTWATYSLMNTDTRRVRRPEEPHLINYIGPPGSIASCNLAQLMGAALAAQPGAPALAPSDVPALASPGLPGACIDLRDKIVLISRDSERPGGDRFRTPLGEMTRAEILANEIATIANHRPIYRASIVEQALIILAMILGGAFYIIYYPVLISAIAITGTGLAVLVLFQLIFHLFDIYIPSANVAGSLLVTYLVFTGYRLAFQENLQWRSLKQAQYLRELDQMKTNFLSLVSHDLKTPLAKIQAVAERLRRELHLPAEERSDWKELVDSIENSNNELKHYITSILNLSRIESQKVILNKKSNDVNRIIQQTLKRLRPLAQAKGITIEESLDPLFSVECDEDLVRQVLSNIVDNAVKYSPSGAKVVVRSREEEGFIRVDVEDNGPGIPKDQLPLMFRKFSRFVRPVGGKAQVKGTGLGLYLSKYFIERHGGSIRVRSVEGSGTTFTFTLPLQGEEAETLLS